MMNQRLVESVAQIVLAMSDDERRLLERKLQQSGLRRLDEPEAADKSLRIAEIAQDIQAFEEHYNAPLSDLPAEQWSISELTAKTMTAKAMTPDVSTSESSSTPLQSFFQPTPLRPTDTVTDDLDYALYEVSRPNGQF